MNIFRVIKQITAILLSIIIIILSSLSFYIPVRAEDIFKTGWEKFDNWATTKGLKFLNIIPFACSQFGALVDSDFSKWLANEKSFLDYWNDSYITFSDDSDNISFSNEFMAYLKQCLGEYAKENEPYKICQTYQSTKIPIAKLGNQKNIYDTLNNLIKDSSSGVVAFAAGYGSTKDTAVMLYADIGSCFKDTGFVYAGGGATSVSLSIYDNDTWGRHYLDVYGVTLGVNDTAVASGLEFIEKAGTNVIIEQGNDCNKAVTAPYINQYGNNPANWDLSAYPNFLSNKSKILGLVTRDGRRIRYYSTYADYTDYMLGRRSVYYTSEYYTYVPEDLTVSIDELQKTIDDMQDVIDKLLEQITDDTSESEIEELLRLILEELRKNPGGGGSGSGGGDVNVDIDLSTTNSLLSKILAKVTQIFDRMQSGGSDGTDSNIFKESLDAILVKLDDLSSLLKKYLSEITGDLDDIKGQLANISEQEFNERSDSFLGEIMDAFSEISEVVKTKFPFSIPNDLRIFLSKIAPAAPETEEQQIESYSLDTSSGMTLYSGEHGGGGTSDGETNPPGGGGSSRPGSGFIDVAHGGSGGSGEPVEMREAPVFRLPIVIERYGIEEYIIIDMAPFDPLSRFSRGFFTIIFMVGLFNLTFKVIGMWGDLIG